jgi:malic enzyme
VSALAPNQINNAVAFPGLPAGLMFSESRVLDIEAGVAARAIAARTAEVRKDQPDYGEVVPKVIDERLHLQVALATLRDVFEHGLNRDGGTGAAPDQAACLERMERRSPAS